MTELKNKFLILKKSRKKVDVGDIFVCSIKEGEYIWGRVIRDGIDKIGFGKDQILVYLYNVITNQKENVPESLNKNDLLLPPFLTIKQAWSRGAFETIEKKMKKEELLIRHCFEYPTGRLVDEYGNELGEKYKPCGSAGFPSSSYTVRHLKQSLNEKRGYNFKIEIDK